MVRFYVVYVGHNPGIYLSWPECQMETHRFSGSLFESFSTREEAEEAFNAFNKWSAKKKSKGKGIVDEYGGGSTGCVDGVSGSTVFFAIICILLTLIIYKLVN